MATPNQTSRPDRHSGLGRLIQFLIELAQARAFAKVTVTLQAGQIEVVHVDRSYKLGELPLRDPDRPGLMG